MRWHKIGIFWGDGIERQRKLKGSKKAGLRDGIEIRFGGVYKKTTTGKPRLSIGEPAVVTTLKNELITLD
ncbi:MAG: hypothetical protein Q7S01_02775 [bacterium]|nr:hypothetical protein [bacterium]